MPTSCTYKVHVIGTLVQGPVGIVVIQSCAAIHAITDYLLKLAQKEVLFVIDCSAG